MEATGDGEPSSFSGQTIIESFGRPQIYNRMLLDSDLRPEFESQHHGSARNVLGQITAGSPGHFTVGRNGRFPDYHGGHGLRSGDYIRWFTDEALARGIGWYFEQTYRHGPRIVGRFRVVRIINARTGIDVRKEQMRV